MAQTGRKVSKVVRQLTSDQETEFSLPIAEESESTGNDSAPRTANGKAKEDATQRTVYHDYTSQLLSINEEMMNALLREFDTLNSKEGAYFPLDDIHDALHLCNVKIPGYKSRIIVESLRPSHPDERISLNEFRELYVLLKPEYDTGTTYANNLSRQDGVRTVQSNTHGSSATVHSVSAQEQTAFANWLERQLRTDPDCDRYLPFAPRGDDLYSKCTDGILLCKLVNLAQPDTIVEKAINQPAGNNKQLSVYQKLENLNLALNSSRALGCNIINIGPDDLHRAREHLLLGIVWQLIKIGLTRSISVTQRSDIMWMISEVRRETMGLNAAPPARSHDDVDGNGGLAGANGDNSRNGSGSILGLAGGEEPLLSVSHVTQLSSEALAQLGEEMRKLTPEAIIINWVNYHLLRAGSKRIMSNFGDDLRDSEIYALLLSQIAPAGVKVDANDILVEKDLLRRAALVISEASRFDAAAFITPESVVECNKNLNLAFLANLFNTFPAITPANDSAKTAAEYEEMMRYWQTLFAANEDETREERTYRNWMNSMGVDPFVQYLYTDLRNALVLFQLYDLIKPGVVDRKKVHTRFHPRRKFLEELENCNYAVHLGKTELKFILVGIGGEDICRGQETLTLGLVWQVMRAYTLTMLASLMQKSGIAVNTLEKEIIEWANSKLRSAGKQRKFAGFHDQSLSDGRVVLDLIDSIRTRSVQPDWVKSGYSEQERMANAQLAITLGRKIGAKIYALPEDIVEVRPKMMLTIFACLMIADLEARQST